MRLKFLLSKEQIQKTAEATGDLAGNSVIVTYVHDKETPKERYISTMKRQEAIDELILTQYKNSKQNNSETTTNKNDKEIPREIPKKDIYVQKKDKKILIN